MIIALNKMHHFEIPVCVIEFAELAHVLKLLLNECHVYVACVMDPETLSVNRKCFPYVPKRSDCIDTVIVAAPKLRCCVRYRSFRPPKVLQWKTAGHAVVDMKALKRILAAIQGNGVVWDRELTKMWPTQQRGFVTL